MLLQTFITKGFTWVLDNTFGWLFKGIFWLLSHILPSKCTLIITEFGDMFWNGIKTTMGIALFGTIFGFVIAILLGTLRTVKAKKNDHWAIKGLKYVAQGIVKAYVTIFRGTPMMVQAMIIYYWLVGFMDISTFKAGLLIVTINTGAYLTEVVKDALLSVDPGQNEAARSLGFGRIRTMILFIYPQALKNSMASIGNEFVINIKDTSVLNVIGCAEMFFALKTSCGRNYYYMEQMITGAIIYLILTYATTKLLHLIEKKLDVPQAELHGSN